jgi:periplasmic protein CpxP/Spy
VIHNEAMIQAGKVYHARIAVEVEVTIACISDLSEHNRVLCSRKSFLNFLHLMDVWMTGSWLFLNSIATGAQGLVTPAFAEKTGPKDEAAKEHCGEFKGHHRHFGRHHGHFGLWKKLNLTDAQKNQIKTIMSEERLKMKPLYQQLKAGRDQLRALPKGQFDEAKVRAIAKGQADIGTELIVEKQRMKSRMYAVLTPEQRAKAEKFGEAWKTLHEDDGPTHKD